VLDPVINGSYDSVMLSNVTQEYNNVNLLVITESCHVVVSRVNVIPVLCTYTHTHTTNNKLIYRLENRASVFCLCLLMIMLA